MLVEGGPECDYCRKTTWDVGILAVLPPAEPASDAAGEETVGGVFADLSPAPMARCAACGWSQRLDA